LAKKGKKRRKSRSAAQKRASKKNIRKAQASRRKKKPKSKRRSKKSNKPKKSTKRSVAGKGKKSLIDKIPGLKNKTVQRIGFGLGMGALVVGIIDFVAKIGPPALVKPLLDNKRVIKLGTELITEPLSAVVDIALTTDLGSFSLSGGQKQTAAINGNGFA